MISLTDKDILAESNSRICYLHPEDPMKVIKISKGKTCLKRRDVNWQEWRHYHDILDKHGKLDFIITCRGFVETTLGPGLMFDCIRDASGEISGTLKTIFDSPEKYNIAEVQQVVDRHCRFLIDKNIQLFDMGTGNIMIQIMADSTYHVYASDLKGPYNNKEFIPISTYIPYFSKQKLNRRHKRLMDLFPREE